jgi:hypothetical protein
MGYMSTRECSRTGIVNRDDTCTFVAVYQLLRKTVLYTFINDDLRHSVDSAAAAGSHALASCVLPPASVQTWYKRISGKDMLEEVHEGGGPSPWQFLNAVVCASDQLQGDTHFNAVRWTVGRKMKTNRTLRTLFAVTTSKRWQINIVSKTLWEQERQPEPHVLEAILTLLLHPERRPVGGILMMPDHCVAFVMCESEPLFHNWGSVMSGTEMLQDLAKAHAFLTGSRYIAAAIESVMAVHSTMDVPANWHLEALSRTWLQRGWDWLTRSKEPEYELGETVQVRVNEDSKWITTTVVSLVPLRTEEHQNKLFLIRKHTNFADWTVK